MQHAQLFVKKFLSDRFFVLLLLALVAITRLIDISKPEATLADETVYANYTMLLDEGKPFFDIHPPLARMLFAGITSPFMYEHMRIPFELGASFGGFPYVSLRLFIALFGILLPLLLYFISRKSGFSPLLSFATALLPIVDNALTLYGRIMIPDMMLLCLNIAAFGAALFAIQSKGHERGWRVACGILAGLALATKWTALGIFPLIAIIYVSKRWWKEYLYFLGIALCTYVTIFVFYFTLFEKQSDPTIAVTYMYDTPEITDQKFPDPKNIFDIVTFLPIVHTQMLDANTDSGVVASLREVPGPSTWVFAKSSLLYWQGVGDQKIILRGNPILYIVTFFLFLIALGMAGANIAQRGVATFIKERAIFAALILGYIANYLPFFFIGRPMYPYHYFTALIFLFLLVPHTIPFVFDTLSTRMGKRGASIFLAITFLAIVLYYLSHLATTYGW